MHRNSLDTKRATALRTGGWLPLFRLRSIGNEGLETGLGTPFESATTAFLHVMRCVIIARILMTARAVVEIRQDMILAIDTSAFIAFDMEKVKFFAILQRAAVADVFKNRFVLSHP
jgi:hypothetical protein